MIKTTRHVSIGAPASTLDFLKVARQVRYESYETLFSTIGFCNTPQRVRYKTYKTQGATLPELLTFHHGADCCGDGLALADGGVPDGPARPQDRATSGDPLRLGHPLKKRRKTSLRPF